MDLVNKISEILYQFDPVGIGRTIDNPHKDEYESEAKDIASGLSKQLTEKKLFTFVTEVFIRQFGEKDYNKAILRKATARIFDLKSSL